MQGVLDIARRGPWRLTECLPRSLEGVAGAAHHGQAADHCYNLLVHCPQRALKFLKIPWTITGRVTGAPASPALALVLAHLWVWALELEMGP